MCSQKTCNIFCYYICWSLFIWGMAMWNSLVIFILFLSIFYCWKYHDMVLYFCAESNVFYWLKTLLAVNFNHYIYIHIYIYIVIHRQTFSLYHNTSVWLDMWDAPSWDWNLPNFTLGWWPTLRPSLRLNFSLRITACASNFVCLHFALSDAKVLNFIEELCIMREATVIFFC